MENFGLGLKFKWTFFKFFTVWSADEMMSRQRDRKTCVLYSLLVMMGIPRSKNSALEDIFLYDIPVIAQESYTSLRMLLMIFHTWKIHYCSIRISVMPGVKKNWKMRKLNCEIRSSEKEGVTLKSWFKFSWKRDYCHDEVCVCMKCIQSYCLDFSRIMRKFFIRKLCWPWSWEKRDSLFSIYIFKAHGQGFARVELELR